MEKETKKKNIKAASICILILIVLIVGLTYAYFKARRQTNIGAGAIDFDLNFVNGPTIESKELNPIDDSKIKTEGIHKSFQMSKKNDIIPVIYTKVKLEEITMSDGLKDRDMRWALYEGDTFIDDGSFINVGSDNILDLVSDVKLTSTTLKTYNLYIWIQETGLAQSEGLMNGNFSAKIVVEGQMTEYGGQPNSPELAEGMIPVIYDELKESWIKADISQKWYDYDEQNWANAVTVTSTNRSTYMSASAGTTIPMDDINTMWVWIPRFKYKIPSNIGSSGSVTSPPEIDVVFESGTSTTGVTEQVYRNEMSTTNTNYYTHPAFRDGSKVYNTNPYDIGGWDKELTGIWVGKFETGTDNETCNITSNEENCKNVDPIIKPDVISLRSQNISTQFTTSLKLAGGTMNTSTGEVTFSGNIKYGLTKDTNTHMMKNTEWGLVAILSQSKYGKKGNNDYTGINKEVYINNSSGHYTGRSGGGPSGNTPINKTYEDKSSTSQYNSYGYYTYNDYLLNYNTNIKSEWIKNKGIGASTTGTIYGIYDMSGGATEYVMGNFNGYSGPSSLFNSGFNGPLNDGTTKTDGISFPESKYYDKYINGDGSNDEITKEKTILGDATWETKKWYSDFSYTVNTESPFVIRRSYIVEDGWSGIFSIYYESGSVNVGNSFRLILVP